MPGVSPSRPPSGAPSVRRLLSQFAALAFLVLGSGLLMAKFAADAVIAKVEQDEIRDKLVQSQLALDRAVRRARQQVEDYAFWDETVRLAVHPHDPGATGFFRRSFVDLVPRSDFGFIELLDTDRRRAFSWTAVAGTALPSVALSPALLDRLSHEESIGGYVRDGAVVYLLAAAAVRQSNGGGTAGAIRGYLVIGREVDTTMLAGLPTATLFTTALLAGDVALPATTHHEEFYARGDSVRTRYLLHGLDGRNAAVVELRDSRSGIDRISHWTLYGALIALLFGAVSFLAVWRYGQRLLIAPLRAVAEEMDGMHQKGELIEVLSAAPSAEWELFLSTFNTTVRSLRDSEQRYRTLFDHSVDPYFLLDAERRTILDANPAAIALTEMPLAMLVGAPLPEFLRDGAARTSDVVRVRRPDGSVQSWGVAETPVEIDGRMVILAAYRDLTDREALAQSQKMDAIGSLAGGLAHDFNNLMGSVLAGVRVARSSGHEDPRGRTALDTIEHAARRAAELTRQLLGVSRHEPLVRGIVDVRTAMTNVQRLCSNAFDARIQLGVTLPTLLPSVESDQAQLEQALLNLCINARDAMPNGGQLRLEAIDETLTVAAADARGLRAGRYVTLRVIDSGEGMSEEVQRRMFEPFFTTKERGKGTGLGLAMVYGFARNAGGMVHVDSAPGVGSTIEIWLPAVGEAVPVLIDAPQAASPARANAGERPLVLLADDEAGLREMLRMVLEHEGFDVAEAANGREAVEVVGARADALAAVLLDVQMPEMDGVAALEEIRRIAPGLPVMLGTGYVGDEDLSALRTASSDELLTKPYDIRALIERLKRFAFSKATVG
jgi:two-component system cell cycle sensor histidine kinase/response regulator CckA